MCGCFTVSIANENIILRKSLHEIDMCTPGVEKYKLLHKEPNSPSLSVALVHLSEDKKRVPMHTQVFSHSDSSLSQQK